MVTIVVVIVVTVVVAHRGGWGCISCSASVVKAQLAVLVFEHVQHLTNSEAAQFFLQWVLSIFVQQQLLCFVSFDVLNFEKWWHNFHQSTNVTFTHKSITKCKFDE